MSSARVVSQTTAIRQGHEIDRDALERYLTAALPAFRGPLEIRQFEGGQSNPTYFLITPIRDYVLRKRPPGQLLPSAHAVDREHRVMHALAGIGNLANLSGFPNLIVPAASAPKICCVPAIRSPCRDSGP